MSGLGFALQLVQVGGSVQLGQLLAPALQQLGQLGCGATVAAGQAHPHRHAVVELSQAIGVQLRVVQSAVEAACRILQLGLGLAQHFQGVAQVRLHRGHVFQRVNGAGGQAVGTVIGFRHGIQSQTGRVQNGLAVAQTAVFGVQRVPLVGLRVELVQLTDLPLQALAFTLQIGLLAARFVQAAGGLAACHPGSLQRLAVHTRLRIDQGTHGVGAGQALPGVLAVDVDQVLAQLAQLRGRGGGAIDPRTALALSVHHTAQQQR